MFIIFRNSLRLCELKRMVTFLSDLMPFFPYVCRVPKKVDEGIEYDYTAYNCSNRIKEESIKKSQIMLLKVNEIYT